MTTMRSYAETAFAYQLRVSGIAAPKWDYRFHPVRRWLFDFAWPDRMIAVEIEGGQWIQGRHNRPAGYAHDIEKYNEATRLGWQVYRFTPQQVDNGEALRFMVELLEGK